MAGKSRLLDSRREAGKPVRKTLSATLQEFCDFHLFLKYFPNI